jgi:hypothetical protein
LVEVEEVGDPEKAVGGKAPVEGEGAHYRGNAYVPHAKPSFLIPMEWLAFR